jgi:hypothetical protein
VLYALSELCLELAVGCREATQVDCKQLYEQATQLFKVRFIVLDLIPLLLLLLPLPCLCHHLLQYRDYSVVHLPVQRRKLDEGVRLYIQCARQDPTAQHMWDTGLLT